VGINVGLADGDGVGTSRQNFALIKGRYSASVLILYVPGETPLISLEPMTRPSTVKASSTVNGIVTLV